MITLEEVITNWVNNRYIPFLCHQYHILSIFITLSLSKFYYLLWTTNICTLLKALKTWTRYILRSLTPYHRRVCCVSFQGLYEMPLYTSFSFGQLQPIEGAVCSSGTHSAQLKQVDTAHSNVGLYGLIHFHLLSLPKARAFSCIIEYSSKLT